MSTSTPLTIGIVGLGTRGQNTARRLDKLGLEFVGTEINEQAASSFNEEFGVEIYETPVAMYGSGVDAAVIATPNKFHESAAVAALERDIHILVAKPLAHTVESAQRILDAEADSDGQCFVGFNNRFVEVVSILQSYVTEGMLGDVTHIEGRYVRRRGIPEFGSWYTSKAIAGGGALIDIGVHLIDLVLLLYDFPDVAEVLGTTRQEFGNHDDYAAPLNMWENEARSRMFDVEDSASAFIEFADGRTASLEVAWAANCKETEEHHYRIRGDEAGAELNIQPDPTLEDTLSTYQTSVTGRPHFVDNDITAGPSDATQNQLEAFVDAIKGGEHGPLATAEQALQTQQIVASIYDR